MLYIRYLILVSGHNIQKISFVKFSFLCWCGRRDTTEVDTDPLPCKGFAHPPVAWLHITDMGDMGGCKKIPWCANKLICRFWIMEQYKCTKVLARKTGTIEICW